jgi:hypothetical protein
LSTASRFVAICPERLGDRKKIKAASYLHDFLVDHQTDASGRVNYGRPFGYAWVRAHWPGNPDDRPPVRTLHRHMATLKAAGKVEARVLGFGGGMIVRVIGSAKWRKEMQPLAVQLPLLTPPPIRFPQSAVDNPVEKPRKSTVSNFHMGPKVALVGGQKWPRKEVKNLAEETSSGASRSDVVRAVEKTPEELTARRQFLADQAEMLQHKFKSSG